MRVTARVPATSANLGPGFDAFGLALDLCNEVIIDTDAEPGITWEGEGAGELPTDGTDLVSRSMAAAVAQQRVQHPGCGLPSFAMHGINRIPLERGLGSSSAAAVAGVALASVLLDEAGWDGRAYTTFAYAAEVEGHPDNAAPAVYGGLTIVADGYVHREEPHSDLRPALLVPRLLRLPTQEARRTLPANVSRADAIYNLAHASLAAIAFTRDPDLLLVALHDRLHEDLRLGALPEVHDVLERLRASQIPACVSGAGPALLAFEPDEHEVPDLGPDWDVVRLRTRAAGVELIEG